MISSMVGGLGIGNSGKSISQETRSARALVCSAFLYAIHALIYALEVSMINNIKTRNSSNQRNESN
jgi:hypothetical protein